MSKRWGPYGWKTLHSIAAAYPDNPTHNDRSIAERWIANFAATIVCPYCKDHFGKMIENFKRQYDILKDKHSFFWFTVKGHNLVNAKLGKPQTTSYMESWNMFKNVEHKSIRDYYYNYITHVIITEGGFDGIVLSKKVKEMRSLDTEFQKWYSVLDWNNCSVQVILNNNPDLSIEVDPATTMKIQQSSRTVAAVPAPNIAKKGFLLRNSPIKIIK
jgi:hypothetical protein